MFIYLQSMLRRLTFLLKALLLPIIVLFTSCNGMQKTNSNSTVAPLQVLGAYKEHWHAGRQQGGSGIDYRFIAVNRQGGTLQFDSVWIAEQKQALSVSASRLSGPISALPKPFIKGDTLLLVATGKMIESIVTRNPSDKAAILYFTIDGRMNQIQIQKLQNKETIARPAQ